MNKKCAIFCASSLDPQHRYEARVKRLIDLIAQKFDVIYGGANVGYMLTVAKQVKESKGKLIGIMPTFLMKKELRFPQCDEWIETPDMNTRKQKIFEMADVFLALPGGVGTYEEVIDFLSWKHIGLLNKRIVLANFDGYFDPLVAQIKRGIEDSFISPSLINQFLVSDNPMEIVNYLSFNETDEMWDIYNSDRQVLAKVVSRKDAMTLKEGEYHLVVYLIIRDGKKVLLQQRSLNKESDAGIWDLTKGSVLAFETSQNALIREVKEELNLDLSNLDLKIKYQMTKGHSHRDFYELDKSELDFSQVKIDETELSEIKFLSLEEVQQLINEGKCHFDQALLNVLFPWRLTL